MPAIDAALDFLDGTGPEFSYGLSNHGPMLAEALIALGQAGLVMPWLEGYKQLLSPLPLECEPISEQNYLRALGDIRRFRDFRTYFQAQLREEPWQKVLNRWVDRLSPGYIAAAMHGVIRTGHAVRSITGIQSESVTTELANGLAYWAARYQCLPEAASGSPVVFLSIYDALREVGFLPEAQRKQLELISEEVADASKTASFPEIINLLDQEDQPDTILTRLTEGFAFVFACNAQPGSVIALVHALTGPYALRHMLPHLQVPVAKKALRYAWQAAAALYVRYGLTHTFAPIENVALYEEPELIERAIATHDEHAVKFVEACIKEHRLNANPVYLAAASICCSLL